ncbi:MAG TPA: hypothetical protein VIS07_19350 [Candidatus Binatia bacterium]
MTYLIIAAGLLVVLFLSIEARLRVTRGRPEDAPRAPRVHRSDARRLRRGRADLRLVRSASVERTRRAHG